MENIKIYWYEMINRPVGIGCQPKGFIATDGSKGNWGIVAYDRELTEDELLEFEMKEFKNKEGFMLNYICPICSNSEHIRGSRFCKICGNKI